MKPKSKRDSMLQHRFRFPHDTFVNHDEAVRIAKRRWKRHRSKHLRKLNKIICNDELESL